MDFELEKVSAEELLAQKNLDGLTINDRRWLFALTKNFLSQRWTSLLRNLFFSNDENRDSAFSALQNEIQGIRNDKLITILTDETKFTLSEQDYIRQRLASFSKELNYLAIFELEGKQESIETHLKAIKQQIPGSKEQLAASSKEKVGFDHVKNQAILLAQKLNPSTVKGKGLMFREDVLAFRKLYFSLSRSEQLAIKREVSTRKSKKSRLNRDQFADGFQKLDSVIS